MSFQFEETPEEDYVDESYEASLRDKFFSGDIPPPDFTLDDVPVQSTNYSGLYLRREPPLRPVDVGIIGLEVLFPERVGALVGVSEERFQIRIHITACWVKNRGCGHCRSPQGYQF